MKHLFFSRGKLKYQNPLMPTVFSSLVILLAACVGGCEKENPLAVDNPERSETQAKILPQKLTLNMDSAKFSFQGALYNSEEFQKPFKNIHSSIMVVGAGLPDNNVVNVFDSDAALTTWAKTTRFEHNPALISEAWQGEDKPVAPETRERHLLIIAPRGSTVYFSSLGFLNNVFSSSQFHLN